MATIKEAVQSATTFAMETLGPERTEGLQLEEVGSANVSGQDAWLITLSRIAPPQGLFDARPLSAIAAISALAEPKRDYKIFTVLKNSGEVTSMRIRDLAVT
jgi:hypothetical protein